MAKRAKKRCEQLPILHPDAAGIDVSASELIVTVSPDRDFHPVRSFPTLHPRPQCVCGLATAVRNSFSSNGVNERVLGSRVSDPRVPRGELYRIFGVDLTNVPGISAITAQTILCEIGTDVSRFRNASAFASWLGPCPENKISDGKVLYTKSRRVRSRVATALRMAANSLHHAKDYLGEFFRRITRKPGKPQAITATAQKLARIVYHLLSTREAYDESVFHRCDEEALKRAQFRLRRQAAQLGFQVIPLQNGSCSLGVGTALQIQDQMHREIHGSMLVSRYLHLNRIAFKVLIARPGRNYRLAAGRMYWGSKSNSHRYHLSN